MNSVWSHLDPGAVLGAVVFIALMSLLAADTRRRFNAIFVAGAGAVYINGGLGMWEFVYIGAATAVAYLGLRDIRYVGVAWLMHVVWDTLHHLYGTPIWANVPDSSLGCAVFDTVIAIWFLLGAPDGWMQWLRRRSGLAKSATTKSGATE